MIGSTPEYGRIQKDLMLHDYGVGDLLVNVSTFVKHISPHFKSTYYHLVGDLKQHQPFQARSLAAEKVVRTEYLSAA